MARQYDVDDSEWIEVWAINGYALFMGYLMMGVRGLGLLTITWTTVVLLGGFVSDLGKKDFWCLTGITLIQTAGVFNFIVTEKISDMVHLSWGLLAAAFVTFIRMDNIEEDAEPRKRLFLAYAASAIQGVVLFVILCPVCILYVFGIYISAGASLWRLIKHDFGNDGDGGANMKPALQVLYSLAVAQGVLFGYKTIHAFATKNGLVKLVHNWFDKQVHEALVAEYLEETVAGCEKDPSFATGRNLVTYGVDMMMEAKSNEGFIAGIKILGGAINVAGSWGRKVLAKYLLARSDDSSSAIIQRLLEMVGPRSPYSREIKGHVVRILDIIAPCIRLEQFPRAIECLCSVVDTSSKDMGYYNNSICFSVLKDYERVELLEEYQKKYLEYDLRIDSPEGTLREKLYKCLLWMWLQIQHCLPGKGKEVQNKSKRKENITTNFDWLLIEAVNIIQKLVADEYNLWILRTSVPSTVLHKIASLPIKLHRESHGRLRENDLESQLQMLEKCRELTERLLVALIETSSPTILPAATRVGEGRQITRRGSKEIEDGEDEQLLVPRTMDGSALVGTIMHTIKHSTESAVKCILDCLDCDAEKKSQAIKFLLHRSSDMPTIVKDSKSSRILRWILLIIYWDSGDGIKRLAGEKLSEMLLEKHGELPSEESARDSQLNGLVLEDVDRAFHEADISIRTHAVIIMMGLFSSLRFSIEQEFLVDAIPKVVMETLIHCGSITADRQAEATDLEKGTVSQDNQDGCIDTKRLRKALVSLCKDMCYYSFFPLSSKFRDIASEICMEQGRSFDDFKCFLKLSTEYNIYSWTAITGMKQWQRSRQEIEAQPDMHFDY